MIKEVTEKRMKGGSEGINVSDKRNEERKQKEEEKKKQEEK